MAAAIDFIENPSDPLAVEFCQDGVQIPVAGVGNWLEKTRSAPLVSLIFDIVFPLRSCGIAWLGPPASMDPRYKPSGAGRTHLERYGSNRRGNRHSCRLAGKLGRCDLQAYRLCGGLWTYWHGQRLACHRSWWS